STNIYIVQFFIFRHFVLGTLAIATPDRICLSHSLMAYQLCHFGPICMFKMERHKVYTILFKAMLLIELLSLNIIQLVLYKANNIVIFKFCSLKLILVLFSSSILIYQMTISLLSLVYKVNVSNK